jgi:hypothetical protein
MFGISNQYRRLGLFRQLPRRRIAALLYGSRQLASCTVRPNSPQKDFKIFLNLKKAGRDQVPSAVQCAPLDRCSGTNRLVSTKIRGKPLQRVGGMLNRFQVASINGRLQLRETTRAIFDQQANHFFIQLLIKPHPLQSSLATEHSR